MVKIEIGKIQAKTKHLQSYRINKCTNLIQMEDLSDLRDEYFYYSIDIFAI